MEKIKTLMDSRTMRNYGLFVLTFIPLLILPTDNLRLFYMNGLSVLLFFMAREKMRSYLIFALLHSAIHNLWPFLTPQGFDPEQETIYDVFCHFSMMFVCHFLIKRQNQNYSPSKKIWFERLSWFFMVGSLVNCASCFIVEKDENSWKTLLFVYLTIFQAVSTGYWVATMLWFNRLGEEKFFTHWLLWIGLMSFNWGLYKYSEELVALSMLFRYIESIFITCIWVAEIDFHLAKSSKQKLVMQEESQ